MGIDRIKFNSLLVEEQVNFFNRKLYEGNTISSVCNGIEVSYNTIRDRFKRHNYIYNKHLRQYEINNSNHGYEESLLEKALEKVVQRIFLDSSDFDTNKAEESLICDLKGNVVNRSFRIYDTVLKDFTRFCEASNYNQYDILSKFIKDGIERYNKIN